MFNIEKFKEALIRREKELEKDLDRKRNTGNTEEYYFLDGIYTAIDQILTDIENGFFDT